MTFTEPTECRICGHTDKRDLRYALVHWREAEPGMQYEHVARCVDHAACRARVELAKKVWPLETNEKRGAA